MTPAKPSSPSESEREVMHQAHMLKQLSETPGWKVFCEMLQNRCDMEGTKGLSPALNLDETLPREYAKGVFFGLRLAMTLPANTVHAAQEIRKQYKMGSNGSGHEPQDVDVNGPGQTPAHPVGHAP